MGRLPVGHVLARLEQPKGHYLDLSQTAQEGPKWMKVLQTARLIAMTGEDCGPATLGQAVMVNVGDRILVKPYCAHDAKLVLPDTPEVSVCELCNASQDDPECPPACLRNPDVREGYGPHQFVPKATPEALLIVNLADVLYCEPA